MNLVLGDCLEVLRGMDADSVDAIVTDPPYGLSFMGNRWDYDVPSVEIWAECLRVLKPGGHLLAFAGTRTQHRMAVRIEDAGFEIRDMIAWVYGSGFPKSHNLKGDLDGWGTALKPALEPITVARKPLVGTVAENVLRHGTGAINVDGCRVGTVAPATTRGANALGRMNDDGWEPSDSGQRIDPHPAGRWPANLIHDGSDEVVGLFPQGSFNKPVVWQSDGDGADGTRALGKGVGKRTAGTVRDAYGDSGSAARFFYCAKASRADRDEGCEGLEARTAGHYAQDEWSRQHMGNTPDAKRHPVRNHHPTVKPTALMRYLCRLVTPPNGIVLDPFMGSGSTGKAAILEGFGFVGIEREPEYLEIARRRIEAVMP